MSVQEDASLTLDELQEINILSTYDDDKEEDDGPAKNFCAIS